MKGETKLVFKIIDRPFLFKVSVRRKVPQIMPEMIEDEPEDWALAFPEVKGWLLC